MHGSFMSVGADAEKRKGVVWKQLEQIGPTENKAKQSGKKGRRNGWIRQCDKLLYASFYFVSAKPFFFL